MTNLSVVTPLLQFDHVSKNYKGHIALKQISFEVQPGEIVAVLGANGAGKSTLMNLASGLSQPSEGEIRVFGQAPQSFEVQQRRRSLPQELHFPFQLRMQDVLALVEAHYPKTQRKFVDELGLQELMSRPCSELSGGERRKLAILCALTGKPDLVLMDEPTANVDLIGQNAIREILLKYFRGGNRSLIFSSHQMHEVEVLADRVIVLKQGCIVACAASVDLKKWMGLKKVRLQPSKALPPLQSAHSVHALEQGLEIWGLDSDEILKEVIQLDRQVRNIEVTLPGLEESILKMWEQGGPS